MAGGGRVFVPAQSEMKSSLFPVAPRRKNDGWEARLLLRDSAPIHECFLRAATGSNETHCAQFLTKPVLACAAIRVEQYMLHTVWAKLFREMSVVELGIAWEPSSV